MQVQAERLRAAIAETTLKINDEFIDVFTGIGCFKGTFFLEVKDNAERYQVSPRHIAYALQKQFKKELYTMITSNTVITMGR